MEMLCDLCWVPPSWAMVEPLWEPSSLALGPNTQSLCSTVWWSHSSALRAAQCLVPGRGSEGTLLTSLKILGFVLAPEEPGRMTLAVIRGFCSSRFLSLL